MPSPTRSRSSRAGHRPYAPRLPPAQRREQLIDAALTVIIDQGYAGVSIESVARTAGVTRPVVYDRFPNLGMLLMALLEREERYAVAQLDSIVSSGAAGGANPALTLVSGLRAFVDAVLSRPATWRIILVPVDGTPEVIRQRVEANRARIRARIAALLGLVAPGGLSGAFDVELLSYAMMHLAEEAGRLALTDPERFSPDRFEQFAGQLAGLMLPHGALAD